MEANNLDLDLYRVRGRPVPLRPPEGSSNLFLEDPRKFGKWARGDVQDIMSTMGMWSMLLTSEAAMSPTQTEWTRTSWKL